ncbi:MAG: hypothetical protein KatS3mg015_2472 [Fimbriimonadales bacterium]|nr:MAG: hypothetical protein KatS3mg015_2472 [Fimbriimonadales bacterium]
MIYKWLNGYRSTHTFDFRYRIGLWTYPISSELVPGLNAYHGANVNQLPLWINRDLYVVESLDEWIDDGEKLYTRGPIRIVEHLTGWNKSTARLFATDCAERVLPIWERHRPNEDLLKTIQAAREYANGLIGRKEARRSRRLRCQQRCHPHPCQRPGRTRRRTSLAGPTHP